MRTAALNASASLALHWLQTDATVPVHMIYEVQTQTLKLGPDCFETVLTDLVFSEIQQIPFLNLFVHSFVSEVRLFETSPKVLFGTV